MQRLTRFASTTLTSLSLALIVLASISGGEAKAMGLFTCGTIATVTYPDGSTTTACSGRCLLSVIYLLTQYCAGQYAPLNSVGDTCNCNNGTPSGGS